MAGGIAEERRRLIRARADRAHRPVGLTTEQAGEFRDFVAIERLYALFHLMTFRGLPDRAVKTASETLGHSDTRIMRDALHS